MMMMMMMMMMMIIFHTFFFPTFFSLHSGFTWNFSLAGFPKQGTLQVHLSGVSISKNLEPRQKSIPREYNGFWVKSPWILS